MGQFETHETQTENPAQNPMNEAFEAGEPKKAPDIKMGSEVTDSYIRERIEGQGYARCKSSDVPTEHYNSLLRDIRKRERTEKKDWIPGAEGSSTKPVVVTNTEKGVEVSTYYKVICKNEKGQYVIARKSEEKKVEIDEAPSDIKEFVEANLENPKKMDDVTPNNAQRALAIIRAVKNNMAGKPPHIILSRKDIISQGFAKDSELPAGSSAIVIADKKRPNKARIYFGELKES